jgi:ATP-dependent Clp protease ATP-binding subunit ClpA
MVEDRLSEGLLDGQFQSGDTVVVDLKEGEIIVHPQAVGALPGEGKPK